MVMQLSGNRPAHSPGMTLEDHHIYAGTTFTQARQLFSSALCKATLGFVAQRQFAFVLRPVPTGTTAILPLGTLVSSPFAAGCFWEGADFFWE